MVAILGAQNESGAEAPLAEIRPAALLLRRVFLHLVLLHVVFLHLVLLHGVGLLHLVLLHVVFLGLLRRLLLLAVVLLHLVLLHLVFLHRVAALRGRRGSRLGGRLGGFRGRGGRGLGEDGQRRGSKQHGDQGGQLLHRWIPIPRVMLDKVINRRLR